ncbi:MAG: ABC transporter permease, partial [Leptolyngbyaceae bacterium]|nr:ABC transporter permease [Leptolyngbyaceae bacterium]
KRGGWMNWAAISTVTVLLFLFGISLQGSWQLEGLLNQFGSQLEVSVYLDTGVDAATLKPVIETMPEVTTVVAISKEESWAALTQEMGISDIAGATQQLNGNPLVDELKVRARSPKVVPILAEQLRKVQGVEEVQYINEAVIRLAQLNKGLTWVRMGITTLLTLTAIAVITTTIRLIVMARRREIEIMQLVGATAAWIYLPFILQGITFGIAGAAIAWGLIYSVQQFLQSLIAQQAEFIKFLATGGQSNPTDILILPLLLLSFGATVGLMGSLFAVRRFAVR